MPAVAGGAMSRMPEPRLKYYQAAPEGYRALRALQEYVNECGLEPALLELVKLRASQINGCAFCIDMHWKDARAMRESEERLYMLDAWHEADVYSATRAGGAPLDGDADADLRVACAR